MTARKVMLLGEIGVGKSSTVQRLVFDRFEFNYKPTIGVDVYRYDVPDGPGRERSSLIVWDTDGNFGDTIFRHVYMKEAAAAMIIGDLSRPQTLETMVRLAEGFADALPGRHISLLLNKSDLVSAPSAVELPGGFKRLSIKPNWTSAKTGENVQNCFMQASEAINRRGQ
jgi:Ras-related protein Rab-5C